MNEIYIIDHSTTTLEAASHNGGNSGKGGDFLWRWGNPKAYHSSFTDADRRLGGQHNCTWIKRGTQQGKISVFSNAKVDDNTQSEVLIVNPSYQNNSYSISGNSFSPLFSDWSWSGSLNGEVMKAAIKSGVQILANLNVLIIESTKGRISEIDSIGNLVWMYEIPHGVAVINQFEMPLNNGAFRATRYSSDYIGFYGKDLSLKEILEDQNGLSENCNATFSSLEEKDVITTRVYPNPVDRFLMIDTPLNNLKYKVYNVFGQLEKEGVTKKIDCSKLKRGVYTIYVTSQKYTSVSKFIKK